MISIRIGQSCLSLRRAAVAFLMLLAGSSVASAQQMSVVNSPHNLSASGPGPIRAIAEDQPCIFCHTPHHSTGIKPLWNRKMSAAVYTPYRSNSLQAAPDQPTGSSKLCLSCHDGTIALGSVLSRKQEIPMANSVTRMPLGSSNLGTDLADDHPVSFAYDQALLQKNSKLRNPTALPDAVKLDSNSELQCVSCHEPHNNQYGKFLVMDNTASQLCNSCHVQGTTTVQSHVNCASCHQPHSAPSGPYLLTGTTVTQTCTAANCHGNTSSETRLNIASDLAKIPRHDTNSAVNLPAHEPDNSVCSDCHEGHTMGSTDALGAPAISPRLGKIGGVNAMGTKVAQAEYQYEVCFKCHGDKATASVTVKARQITQVNKRLQFATGAVGAISYHPIEGTGKNSIVPSLLPPWSATSLMYCTDCHASNSSPAAGGAGAKGPHGSTNAGLLVLNYSTADGTPESPSAYALCYRCHDRNSIITDASFPGHKEHVVDRRTPCSVCHDSHGISSTQGTPTGNAHLINFDTAIVQPMPGRGLKYESIVGQGGGCTLTCHGKPHIKRSY